MLPPELSGLQLLAGNAARERREYEQEFAQPLDDIVRSLIAGQSSRTSPILESLTAAVEQSLAAERAINVIASSSFPTCFRTRISLPSTAEAVSQNSPRSWNFQGDTKSRLTYAAQPYAPS